MGQSEKPWVTKNLGLSFILMITGLSLLAIPFIVTQYGLFDFMNLVEKSGEIGDTIGGISAPVIGILGMGLTFLAFYIQYEANKLQRADISRERFENQFYEMLRLHKENVNEMNIDDKVKGRKAFVHMFYELRCAYGFLKSSDQFDNLTDEDMIKVAYHHMFWGVDLETQRCNQPLKDTFKKVSKFLSIEISDLQQRYLNQMPNSDFRMSYSYKHNGNSQNKVFEMKFYPFDGHVSRLAHTYRHLFQMIKHVVGNGELTWKEKYGYVKLLRAQLSNHEQALIFFNAIWFGNPTWWADQNNRDKDGKPYRYLLNYALIKNIPFNLTSQLGPDVREYFKEKLGDGPHFIDPDKPEVTKEKKLTWLFEWTDE